MVKNTLKKLVTSKLFRTSFLILSIIFVIASLFISVNPDTYIQFGYPGIAILNAAGSGLLLIPSLSTKFNIFLLALTCAFGNIINTSINYVVGSSGKSFLVHASWIQRIKDWMKRFEGIVIYLLAIAPLPVDVNGLLSGYIGVSYKKYILINFLGKVTIFLLVGLGVITIAK